MTNYTQNKALVSAVNNNLKVVHGCVCVISLFLIVP